MSPDQNQDVGITSKLHYLERRKAEVDVQFRQSPLAVLPCHTLTACDHDEGVSLP